MKAFLIAIVATVGIAAGAWVVLDGLGWSSAERYQVEGAVRLD